MATEDDEERAAAVAIKPQSVAILSQHSSLSTSYAAAIITLGWEGSDAIMELVEEEESSKINRVEDAWEVGIGLRETLTSTSCQS